jgi:hypothetical protein
MLGSTRVGGLVGRVINWDGTGLRRLTDDSSDTAPSWR